MVKGRKFRFLASLLVAALLFVQNAAAVPVEVKFDFDDDGLPYLGLPAEIETYMEGLYGSDITVNGGIVGNGLFNGPLGPDHYIQAGPTCGTSCFSFSFNSEPITSASFEWAAVFSKFHAYADDAEIFNQGWSCWNSGSSGTIYFDSPVTTLEFTGSCLGEIEVDNLIVSPAPEPATIVLLLLGGLLLRRYKK